MEITRLPPGEIAPPESDCVKISRSPDGGFTMVTSALVQCDDDEDQGASEAVVSSKAYDSYDDAERAGLAWAAERCVETVFVETD